MDSAIKNEVEKLDFATKIAFFQSLFPLLKFNQNNNYKPVGADE